MKIHFVGIGGRGVSRLAQLAMQMGHEVSGSDKGNKPVLDDLARQGIKTFDQHSALNVDNVNLVIHSSAIPEDNAELAFARSQCIPTFSLVKGLAKLLKQSKQEAITIIGTYGKTTTTTLLATILSASHFDPTIYVGGRASNLKGQGAYVGSGHYAILEADEYKGQFFDIDSSGIILTGIEPNHLDYYRTTDNLCRAFVNYIYHNSSTSQVTLVCNDSRLVAERVIPVLRGSVITYGLSNGEWQAQNVHKAANNSMEFEVLHQGTLLKEFRIYGSGFHLIQNALAAIAMASELGETSSEIFEGLLQYRDPERHFEKKYDSNGLIIVDDNARIPIQIKSAIEASRWAFPSHNVVVIGGFWGRLNARELELYASSLCDADHVFLLPVGNASTTQGGAERPDADYELAYQIEQVGKAKAYVLENHELIVDVIRNIRNRGNNVTLLTLGYDSYTKDFQTITSNVIGSID